MIIITYIVDIKDRKMSGITSDIQVQIGCKKCTRGELTTRNPHTWGECDCECHKARLSFVSSVQTFTGWIYNYQIKGTVPEAITINGKQFVAISD